MSNNRTIPSAVTRAQYEASDPNLSAFVSANAGAGKTYVLVQRVARLMLEGASPEKILCVTFTKAAAANMANRLFHHLAGWIALDDAALDRALEQIGKGKSGPVLRRRARELFARALETPGGIKIQTIHALCTRILQQFPLEANVSARFAVLDDREKNAIFEQALDALLTQADNGSGDEFAQALMCLQDHINDRDLFIRLKEAALMDNAFVRNNEPQTLAIADHALRDILGLKADQTRASVEYSFLHDRDMSDEEWQTIADLCAASSDMDKKTGCRISTFLNAPEARRLSAYLDIFLTSESTIYKRFLTKGIADSHPHINTLIKQETERFKDIYDTYKNVRAHERSFALLKAARAIYQYYHREKQRRGALDYDDLVEMTAALLANTDASWVHYKLDMGIDHVLLDEAQDTNQRQWKIIASLIQEFTSGEGARNNQHRSLFAVGDEKQSIFAFNGASREQMQLWLKTFEREFIRADKPFKEVRFSHSFRSGKSILDAVSAVFSDPALYPAITSDKDGMPPHLPLDDAPPGMVEIWPPAMPDKKEPTAPWNQPFDTQHTSAAPVKLAGDIAKYIGDLMRTKQTIGRSGEERVIMPKDVLVLVRNRNAVFHSIIAALKRAQIPVAGADRFKLTEHPAIIDLMNLADAILLSYDDLALAVALKSPLFGFCDDHLMALSPQRKGTLRMALREHAAQDEFFRAADARLAHYEREAQTQTPFGFFAGLLGGDGGRQRFFARLSPEASDAIDEFLECALAFEDQKTPSLQGFLAWLRRADTELKRDMDANRNEVRVMTAHGAKGLEAPLVILADTMFDMGAPNKIRLATISSHNDAGAPHPLLWFSNKKIDSTRLVELRANVLRRTHEENLRLLYVAMTRAAERLVVSGFIGGNHNAVPSGCWYDIIANGLERAPLMSETLSYDFGEARLYYAVKPPAVRAIPKVADEEDDAELPSWLIHMPAPDERSAEPLRPSQAIDEAGSRPLASSEDALARMRAMERGTLTHRLLQSLPDLAPDKRLLAAQKFLDRNAAHWNADERIALVEKTLAVLDDPRLAALFQADSRAEVSIAGRLARKGRPDALVSGQVDRLVIAAERIVVADYKTNVAPPAPGEEPPAPYVAQLALYRAVLATIYPGRAIEAWLIWTETLEITQLSPAQLDAALGRIISS